MAVSTAVAIAISIAIDYCYCSCYINEYRWGLPVPFKVPLLFAVGDAISVQQCNNPTNEQVAAVHAQFCKALVALFDKYKHTYGWSHKTLRLV